jgi:hypothetical protein
VTVCCDVCQVPVEGHDKPQMAVCLAAMLGAPIPDVAAPDVREDATAALVAYMEWVAEGADKMLALWDLAEHVESPDLVSLVHVLTDREAGLAGAISQLVRHVEDVLGRRHGRGPIMDGDLVVAAVDRSAASTKWRVDEAWPAIHDAIRKADRQVVDQAAGELEDDTARAVRILKALCGVSYLRTGPCAELGLDPDDYRTKSNWRWVVKTP